MLTNRMKDDSSSEAKIKNACPIPTQVVEILSNIWITEW